MSSDEEEVVLEEEEELEDDVEEEAGEKEGGDEDGEEEEAPRKKKRGLVDDAADEEEEEGSDADSSEEEEEGVNEYEQDGFVVDDVAEEESRRKKKKKKKKKRKKSPGVEIVEEDYDLGDEGPVARPEARKPKRLKKAGDGRREMQSIFGDELDLEDELLGEEGGEEGGERARQEEEDDYVYGSDDELDDFIVDAGDDGEGRPRRRRRKPTGMFAGLTEQAVQDMMEIFGEPEQMLAMYEQQKAVRQKAAGGEPAEGGPGGEGAEGEEDYEPEYGTEEHDAWLQRRQEAKVRKALEKLDPELAERHHLRPEDKAVVATDLPERLQELGDLYRLQAFDEEALSSAADWIHAQLFAATAPERLEKRLVLEGLLEVSTNPPGMDAWPPGTIRGAVHEVDLFGRRGVREARPAPEWEKWAADDEQQQRVKEAIRNLLVEVFTNGNEVAFAAMHRKDGMGELMVMRAEDLPEVVEAEQATEAVPAGLVLPEGRRVRRWEVLWAVFEQALAYLRLQQTKQRRQRQYEEALVRAADNAPVAAAVQQCLQLLQEADTEEAVRDVEARYALVVEAAGAEVEVRGRRPTRSSPYRTLLALGLADLVKQMAMDASAYGENVEAGYKKHEPTDPRHQPEDIALAFVREDAGEDAPMSKPEGVLNAAVAMAAIEIAADANVRQGVREMFYSQALVSTEPTSAHEDLDPMSEYGPVKRLRGKPLAAFQGSPQYLLLDAAVTKGIITSTLAVPEDVLNGTILKQLGELYTSDNVAPVSMRWNERRMQVIREALEQHLFPRLEREARARLKAQARDAALREAGARLWTLAARAPLRVYDRVLQRRVEGARVMAVVWGSGADHPTCAAFLDQHGMLVDMLTLPQLSGGGRRGPGPRVEAFSNPRKEKDARRVLDMMVACRTTHIVLACSSPQCAELQEDLQECINQMLMDEASHLVTLEAGNIELVTASEEVARLWQDCATAKEELNEYPAHIRRAIGLGRFHLEPLAVVAALTANRVDVHSLNLHPLQRELPQDALWRELERVLVTATCQVGVDLNRASMFPWLSHTLQYAAGLGPRKAGALLADARRYGAFADRVDARKNTHLAGQRCVFRNAGPALRIREVQVNDADPVEDPDSLMDDSRIPPDAYKRIALPVARAAADPDLEDAEDIYRLVKHVATTRQRELQELNLGLLAAEADLTAHISQVVDIQMELLAPSGEMRPTPLPLNQRDLFLLMHGETPESLAKGKMVDARVVRVGREHVRCVLPSNAEAVIMRDDVKTGGWGGRLDELVQPGRVQACRVVDINSDERAQEAESMRMPQYDMPNPTMESKMVVYLACRKDYLDPQLWEAEVLHAADPYYHILSDEERRAKADAEAARRRAASRAQQRLAVTRNIKHPLFKNWSMMEATKNLETNPEMDCVIRPANRSAGSLSLTLKLDTMPEGSGEYAFIHTEIKEAPRADGAVGARLGLSTPLSIAIHGQSQPETYEDLDEVYASYVEPLLARVREVRQHRKYVDGDLPALEERVKADRRAPSTPPNALLYQLGFYAVKPGMCVVVFSVNASEKTYKEYFAPTAKGFYFRRRFFPTLEHMLASFKKDPTQSIQKGSHPHHGHPHGMPAYPQPGAPHMGYGAPGAYPPMGYHGGYAAPPPTYGHMPVAYPPAPGGYAPVPAAYAGMPPPGPPAGGYQAPVGYGAPVPAPGGR